MRSVCAWPKASAHDPLDRPKPGRLWIRFSRFVATEVFADLPEMDEVKVRIDLVHAVPPDPPPPGV